MALTDSTVRHAQAREKSYKMADSGGLYIQVMPSGGKHWKMKYRFEGREKKLSFGEYPRVSLRDARDLRDEARAQITKGIDPSFEKRRNRLRASVAAVNSFSELSQEYCNKRRRDGDKAWAPSTAKRCEYLLSLLENSIGPMAIEEIEPIDVLAAVRKIEARGTLESSRRTMQLAGAHYEISWVLFLTKMLKITLPANWVQPVTKLESSACALVLLDLRQMGLIDGMIDVSLWTEAMTVKGLESNLWLVAYEADLKGWLTPPTTGFVQNHLYFAALRRHNVSFYDNERRLKNVRHSKPKKPSDAFVRHMATLRSSKIDEIGAQDFFGEWEFPGDDYGGY